MTVIRDDKHALRLNCWLPEEGDVDIDIIHPQSCKVWWGCAFRSNGFSMLDCKPYHHAHWRYDCPVGYLEEAIGTLDTLGIDLSDLDRAGEGDWILEVTEHLRKNTGKVIPIIYEFGYGTDYWGEYDEDFSWSWHD